MLRQVLRDYQTCDWCGAMTRGRYSNEPDILRCGACHYPLSEGSFIVQAPRQAIKADPKDAPHRAVRGVRPEFGPEWIRLAGQW